MVYQTENNKVPREEEQRRSWYFLLKRRKVLPFEYNLGPIRWMSIWRGDLWRDWPPPRSGPWETLVCRRGISGPGPQHTWVGLKHWELRQLSPNCQRKELRWSCLWLTKSWDSYDLNLIQFYTGTTFQMVKSFDSQQNNIFKYTFSLITAFSINQLNFQL